MVAMTTFPVIFERACRDRAVTQHQMETFRQAWSSVAGLMVVDPTILPTSNNLKSLPFQFLKDAFPSMTWKQPRNNRRAMYMTSKYLTPPFAEDLAALMGCPAETTGCQGRNLWRKLSDPRRFISRRRRERFREFAVFATRKERWDDAPTRGADC